MTERKLLIDADVLVYEVAYAAQKTRYCYTTKSVWFDNAADAKTYCTQNNLDYRALRKDGSIVSEVQILPPSACKMILKQKLDGISSACASTNIELFLSGDGNYRDKIAVTKPYKANRPEKPQHYAYVRELILGMNTVCDSGIEADDCLGIEMNLDPDAVLCTVDKDLNMIEGRHYLWDKGVKYKVNQVDAHRWFLRQMLTGDSVDTIPGIPGVGEKRANDLLDPVRTNVALMWQRVQAEYKKGPFKFKDGTKTSDNVEEYLTEQGGLLWIQRKPNERWSPEYYTKEYIK